MFESKILWQPVGLYQSNLDFKIILDYEFSKQMLKTKICDEIVRNLNSIGSQILENKGFNYLEPFQFFEDTAFVKQFYLGENGVWLSTNESNISKILNPQNRDSSNLEYYSHNIIKPQQANSLMGLVDLWSSYSDVLK